MAKDKSSRPGSKPPKEKDIGGKVHSVQNNLSPGDVIRFPNRRSGRVTSPRPAKPTEESAPPFSSISVSPLTKHRLDLQAAGFSPIPAVGKETKVPGWQTMEAVSARGIERWEKKHSDHLSTGLLAGPTPGLDIDILNERAAQAAEDLVRERFKDKGKILIRVGQAPKRLIPFKTVKPFRKKVVVLLPRGWKEGDKKEKIEFLGLGQMYLEDGIHPDTQEPYAWHGGSLGEVSHDELPEVAEVEAEELVETLIALLIDQHGYTRERNTDRNNFTRNFNTFTSQDFAKAKFALTVIPSDDEDVWYKVRYALANAEKSTPGNEDWFGLYNDWSATCPEKYNSSKVLQMWEIALEHDYSWSCGTLYMLAGQHDPDWWKRYSGALPPRSTGSDLIRASDIEMREREWLWFGHLLKGALELLTGLPGLGKSQVQIDYVACVTSGKPWPDGAAGCKPANAIMLTAEDALDTEILPRLKAAGADLDRVYILRCIHTDKKTKRQFLLGEDLDELKKRIVEVGDVGLVTIDPITAYMGGKLDSHKATEVRSQLGPLKDLAEETNIAFSAITHPPKASKQSAIDSFIGSQAFVAAARVGHMCIKEYNDAQEETGRVLYTHAKYNSSARMPTLAYQVEIIILGQGLRGVIDAPRVEWAAGAVDLTADQALAASRSMGGDQGKVQAFIWDMLKDGPVLAKDIDAAARANDFSVKQVRTAKEKLKIVSENAGPGTPWFCRLPGV